ncbi:XRE family transcriptional regulator, partial [Pseudomonas sp. MWU12-2534b]
IDFRCVIRQMRIDPKRPRGGGTFPAADKPHAGKTTKTDA